MNIGLMVFAAIIYFGIALGIALFPFYSALYQRLVWDNKRKIGVDEIIVATVIAVTAVVCWVLNAWIPIAFVAVSGQSYFSLRARLKRDQEEKNRMK